MTVDQCFYLGFISKLHGLNGELTCVLDVDEPGKYKKLESVFLEIKGQLIPFFIDSLQLKPNGHILRIRNVADFAAAEALVGAQMYLPLEMLPPLKGKRQFYYHEVIGYTVFDSEHGNLGQIQEVYDLPQNPVFAILHNQKEVLIPIQDHIVKEVIKESREIHVELPDGLLDVYA